MSDSRLRLLNVSGRLLSDALHFDKDTEIVAVEKSNEYPDAFRLLIRHPDFSEVPEGNRIPTINAVYHMNKGTDPDVITMEWDLR